MPNYTLPFGVYKINIKLKQATKTIEAKMSDTKTKANTKSNTKSNTNPSENIYVAYNDQGIQLFTTHKINIYPLKFEHGCHSLKKFVNEVYQKRCSPTEIIGEDQYGRRRRLVFTNN